MTDFQIKRLPYNLTSQAGLSLVGQYLKRYARIDQVIDPRFPIAGQGGIATSSIIKAYVGLLCTAKSDFDAIESLRRDAFFHSALGLSAIPSSPTLRQRMDALGETGDVALTALDEANEHLLRRAKPTYTALSTGHLALDFDVFTLDNSNTAKEGVGRTYMGFDGYAPIAAYLAEEGFCLGLELRPGTQHSACETPEFLRRVLPRALALTSLPLLVRADSGFDSLAILVVLEAVRAIRPLDWLVKWNPRSFDAAALHQRLAADPATVWTHPREGKREAFVVETITRDAEGQSVAMRRVINLVERTIDRHGQRLLVPDIEVEGWLTSLDLPAAEIVKLYQGHGTHEQFHSEFKTDLDLERLPSGKFATNDLVLSLAVLAFNILRAIGQATLIEPDSPVRHPAKRRRLRTVMQEIIGIAARVIHHARRFTLGLGEHCAAFAVFERHHQALLRFSG
jgi:Transposase DDE domain group 1